MSYQIYPPWKVLAICRSSFSNVFLTPKCIGLLIGLEKWQEKLQGRLKTALKRNHALRDQLRAAQAHRTKHYELLDVSVAFAQFVNSLPNDD